MVLLGGRRTDEDGDNGKGREWGSMLGRILWSLGRKADVGGIVGKLDKCWSWRLSTIIYLYKSLSGGLPTS